MAGPSRYFNPFTVTMASAGTLTGEIDLGGAWYSVYLEIPTLTSNTQHHIQVANTSGGTYRRIYHAPINSATSSSNVFAISSGVTNGVVPIPGGIRYIKIETTATVNDGAVYRVFAGD